MSWFSIPAWIRFRGAAGGRVAGDAGGVRIMRLPIPLRGTVSAPGDTAEPRPCRVVDVGPCHATLQLPGGANLASEREFKLEFTLAAAGGVVRARARLTGVVHPAPGSDAVEARFSGLPDATRDKLARMVRGSQGYGGAETDAEMAGRRISRIARGAALSSLAVAGMLGLFAAVFALTGMAEDPPIDRVPATVRDRAVRLVLRNSPTLLEWWESLSEDRKQDVLKKGRAFIRERHEKERDDR